MKLTATLLLIFAIVIGVATFIENDFGTESAVKDIYGSTSFELLLFFTSLNLILAFFKYRMYQFKKWYISLFHLSFIVVIIGAYITRYYSFEGVMHIREGNSADFILSQKSYIDILKNGKTVESEPYLFSNLSENSFQSKFDDFKVELKEYIPYSSFQFVESNSSKAISKLTLMVMLDENLDPVTFEIQQGEFKDLGFVVFDFDSDFKSKTSYLQDIIKISKEEKNIKIYSESNLTGFSMDTQTAIELGKETSVQKRVLFKNSTVSFVFREVLNGVEERLVSNLNLPKNSRESFDHALRFEISKGEEKKEILIFGKSGSVGEAKSLKFGSDEVSIKYGSKPIKLPFSIYLENFELERYAGSMSPSSYSSDVVLVDNEKSLQMNYKIYMNHVLDHRGYRFFQSSYDMDERGTVLSVNFDPIGTPITYLGYFLMFLGLFATLFGKASRFQKLRRDLGKLSIVFLVFTFGFSGDAKAERLEIENINTIFKFDKNHSNNFGKLLVSDSRGRIKPLDSLNLEIVNKIHRSENISDLNHNQIVLGMILKPQLWKQIKMIYVKDERIGQIIGLQKGEKFASFEEFFEDPQNLGGYKLISQINEAQRVPDKNRGTFEKNLIKIDERVNIAYMVYSGTLLNLFPNPATSGATWSNTVEAIQTFDENNSLEVRNIIFNYFLSIDKALKDGDWQIADQNLENIKFFQNRHGNLSIDRTKIEAEILYNKLQIFSSLLPYVFGVGFLLLIIGFVNLLKEDSSKLRPILAILRSSVFLIFIIYSAGMLLRWYISGHAPWSDAYESLVYIGWATLLAGIIFSKSSPLVLASTTILTGIILFVANLNWLDPQITNLVPVLKSYWLTIHVSLITASYGFLGLGAILGFVVLLLFSLKNEINRDRFEKRILELNIINEMNLIIGLVLLTVGNFLGGIWANESWGRYWGWDPKETWALVTILIYAVVIHSRFIPALKSQYSFALISLLAFSSVIMTYFGVNFYLSGMHSYAQGDPVPVPDFVFYLIGVIFGLSVLAYRKREFKASV
jgi:cytochrome c-type biogenesis protein CcsB